MSVFHSRVERSDVFMFFSSSSEPPLLSHPCRLPRRRLWLGRAELYDDRVCIQGWTWHGRYRRIISLESIDRVQWWAVVDEANFVLHLNCGETVPLRLLHGAGTWNVKMHSLLGKSLLAHHSLPDVAQEKETTQ